MLYMSGKQSWVSAGMRRIYYLEIRFVVLAVFGESVLLMGAHMWGRGRVGYRYGGGDYEGVQTRLALHIDPFPPMLILLVKTELKLSDVGGYGRKRGRRSALPLVSSPLTSSLTGAPQRHRHATAGQNAQHWAKGDCVCCFICGPRPASPAMLKTTKDY